MKPAIPQNLPILSKEDWLCLIPSLGKANRKLAEYNGMLRRLPNSSLLLSPLTMQEAVMSSRIEGTLATMSEVLQFEAGEIPERESRRYDIEEILNYRHALEAAMDELNTRPFSLNLLLKLHKILLESVRGHNKAPGEFRKKQNYVGSILGRVEQIRFVPPEWTRLRLSLDNWEKYYHNEEEDPLVRLALVHAQFEFLHPFLDGNGRIGRILIPLFLFEKGLLSQPTFYLSEYIEEHRDEYIDCLNALGKTKVSWRNWVAFFLQAVAVQAERNAQKADAILELYESLKQKFIQSTGSKYAVPLLDAVFERPYFHAGQLQWKQTAPSKPTMMGMMQSLARENVITLFREGTGRRPSIWALRELVDLAEKKF